MKYTSLYKITIYTIHHSSDDGREDSSPDSIDSYHMPTPPLHHTHTRELIGHIGSESEESTIDDDFLESYSHINSGEYYEKKEYENIEEIKSDCCNKIHICIEICRDIFFECWKYHEPDHDTIKDEKRQDT